MSRGNVVVYGGAIVFAVALFVLALRFVEPPPPTKIVLATGSSSGTYYELGKRYRDSLAKSGLEVEIIETRGSIENVEALRNPESDVDIAFVQTGTALPDPTSESSDEERRELSSLASLYYEPLWVFHRLGDSVRRVDSFRNRRVAVGPLAADDPLGGLGAGLQPGVCPAELGRHLAVPRPVPARPPA